MRIATQPAWSNAEGNRLVEAGDGDAAILLASTGHKVPEETLAAFSNADEFFEDPNATPVIDKEHTENEPKDPSNPSGSLVTITRIADPEEGTAAKAPKSSRK